MHNLRLPFAYAMEVGVDWNMLGAEPADCDLGGINDVFQG